MATLTGGEFVGRQQEMGKLKGALEDALSGRGQLLMLVGEPGIGKTRTAQELAAHAETRGAQVLWGWCYEEEGAPPFWPWVQPIRAYVQERGSEQLQSEMGPGAADIAEVVSEVRAKLPNLKPPQPPPRRQVAPSGPRAGGGSLSIASRKAVSLPGCAAMSRPEANAPRPAATSVENANHSHHRTANPPRLPLRHSGAHPVLTVTRGNRMEIKNLTAAAENQEPYRIDGVDTIEGL
jgi:hypothetical protein